VRPFRLFGALALIVVGCGGEKESALEDAAVPDDSAQPSDEDTDASADLDAEDPELAPDDAATVDATKPDAAADAAGGDAERVPLPDGSKELSGIVNLVDTKAAEQLEQFITSQSLLHPTRRHGLTEAANLFLRLYPEDYDFLFFFTDHPIPNAGNAAVFEAVNTVAEPGGGREFEIRAEGYQSNGKLLGVIGVQHRPGVYPPLAHETVHHWANHLDPRFGFGADNGMGVGAHWGYSSVHGQLGGFDGQSLRCVSPAGARPPACVPEANGRIRYLVDWFFPNDNTARPYAALELYLMGVAPASAVPATFQVLEKAAQVDGGRDPDAGTVLLEATGLKQVAFSEIVARHGTRPLRPEAERHFRAAFVVISQKPAADDVLTQVSRWAAVFGNRTTVPGVASFQTLAGGLATMDTTLGPRRTPAAPPPAARGALTCDVLAQDCPRAELGCYLGGAPLCALSRHVALDQPCDSTYACAPGLDCVSGKAQPSQYVCKPYCSVGDAASPKACQKLCAGSYLTIKSGDKELGALCLPP
jgi:hypothetical protein